MKFKKADMIIIIVVLLLAGIMLLVNFVRGQNDSNLQVEVRINGEVVETFPLDQDVRKVFESEYGMNVLEIHEGVVTVSESDCHDLICVETKDGKVNGDAIVCVPNRFTVEVIGGEESDIDAISR